jgi:protein-S-isoprenylcysteine O-methyltransferase Ste14
MIFIRLLIPALWLAWGIYWVMAARDVKQVRWRETPAASLTHLAPLALATVLLGVPDIWPSFLLARLWPHGWAPYWIGVGFVAGGLLFSIWARLHIGRNWSGSVTVKEDHALVRSGPYRIVRHPIYTGLILAFLGSAIALGQWRGLASVLLAFLSFTLKSRSEEVQMAKNFPDYAQYRREIAALIPFIF